MVYSPFHRHLRFQQNLQLYSWQTYRELFSTPQGLFSIGRGLKTRNQRHHSSCLVSITTGWGEAVVKGRYAKFFHSVVGTRTWFLCIIVQRLNHLAIAPKIIIILTPIVHNIPFFLNKHSGVYLLPVFSTRGTYLEACSLEF